jgi:DNA-binding CsgD family transcriptional regulator/PAS domain-containing protein
MCAHDELTPLVASIYDAALDSALWPDVLASIAGFVGGQVGGLLAKDATNHVNACYHAGLDPDYLKLYSETYGRLGPVATSAFCEVGEVVSVPQLVPYDEFCRGTFYQEWARPQGWVDVAIGVLEKSASGCAYLSMARREASGMVDDEMRRRMSLVVPHVRRAVLIGQTIGFKQAETATFAGILDGLGAGLFVIDSSARIVHANRAGHEILDAGDILRATDGRLVADDAHADRILRETAAAAENGDAAIGVKGIALPLNAQNGDRYVAHVLPLTSGARGIAGAAYQAAAAVFVRHATMACPSPPEVIGKAYNMTPTELRVLLAIVEIGGVPDVAAALGIAETTVKTHLGRLFEKTRTGRQADLVKVVAGFATPLYVDA